MSSSPTSSSAAGGSSGWGSNAFSVLRRFDAYPKPLDDFRVRTRFGGLMTLACGAVMLLLFASEIVDFARTELIEELIVDTTRSGKLKINLDIIFDELHCDSIGVDAVDVSGEQHLDITKNVLKRRLNATTLRPIEGKIPAVDNHEVTGVIACGSCYGAETETIKCCNTCDDVRKAYQDKSWIFDAKMFEQCRNTVGKEACQVYGYIEVNRVGGSFHVAPGNSFSFGNVHVHHFDPDDLLKLNTSHTIRHLSFGRQLQHDGGSSKNPLDAFRSTSEHPATMFNYHIKIVPTIYVRKGSEETFATNQYSVTRHVKPLSQSGAESGNQGGNVLPGAFFNYELAPVMVRYSEKEKSVGHFVTGLCAIIGGVFTVAGLIDKLFYSSSRLLQEKFELGKAI